MTIYQITPNASKSTRTTVIMRVFPMGHHKKVFLAQRSSSYTLMSCIKCQFPAAIFLLRQMIRPFLCNESLAKNKLTLNIEKSKVIFALLLLKFANSLKGNWHYKSPNSLTMTAKCNCIPLFIVPKTLTWSSSRDYTGVSILRECLNTSP